MKKSLLVVSAIVGGAIAMPSLAADPSLKTNAQKFSYTLGVQVGENMKSKGMPAVDPAAFSQGMSDAQKNGKLRLTREEMKAAIETAQAQFAAERAAAAAQAQAKGDKFRAANGAKPGVTTLENGLQYKVLKQGDGPRPSADDTVAVHYRGMHIDGREFDSSDAAGEPVTFPVGAVIEGWQKALLLMPAGSRWQVVIPPELAYGEHGAGNTIAPGETLVFEIELVRIEPAAQAE